MIAHTEKEKEEEMGGMEEQKQKEMQMLEKRQVFKIQGRDKRGCKILHILAKNFPAGMVRVDAVKEYLREKIYPILERQTQGAASFSILYVHTGVDKSPGISALRCIFDDFPPSLQIHLDSVYFLHPTLHSRLFLATFGRFFFSPGLYGKVKYVRRVDYLWEHIRRNDIELPDYVYDHDRDLEFRPMMDYGLESDHPRVYAAPSLDSPVAIYSMRCLS